MTREILGHTTSVLFLIVDVTPDFGCNVRLAGSKDFFQMPVSPVCLDTLVLATVGAAVNLNNMYAEEVILSATGQVKPVSRTVLTGRVSIDIKHPLLFVSNSHNILMRELFPQLKQKASPFGK